MHGAGNDFVLLDLRRQSWDLDAPSARSIADRKTGVGCDQLLVLREAGGEEGLLRFEVWNADGSKAEQCGNGVRCIAHYLHVRGEVSEEPFRLRGPVNTIEIACLGGGMVRVNMGRPEFRPDLVPIEIPPQGHWYSLESGSRDFRLGAVSMGNPHAVVPVQDVIAVDIQSDGPDISGHAAFPEGCNVGFAQQLDRETIWLRVFERGAGETRACGSGACAAVAVLGRQGELATKVSVIQAGGELIIGWNGEDESVHMTGPAVHVFEGILQ